MLSLEGRHVESLGGTYMFRYCPCPMENKPIDLQRFTERVREFNELSTQEKPDMAALKKLEDAIAWEWLQIRSSIQTIMTVHLLKANPELQSLITPNEGLPVDSHGEGQESPQEETIRKSNWHDTYQMPTNQKELKQLLGTPTAIGKAVKYKSATRQRLLEIQQQANLEYRPDLAILGSLLEAGGNSVSLQQLEQKLGYNVGTLLGALSRLSNKGLITQQGEGYAIVE